MQIHDLAVNIANSFRQDNVAEIAEIKSAGLDYNKVKQFDNGDDTITVNELENYLNSAPPSFFIYSVNDNAHYKIRNGVLEKVSQETEDLISGYHYMGSYGILSAPVRQYLRLSPVDLSGPEITSYLKILKSNLPNEREKAIFTLLSFCGQRCYPTAYGIMQKDEDPTIRLKLLNYFVSWGIDESVPFIGSMLADSSADIRRAAIYGLMDKFNCYSAAGVIAGRLYDVNDKVQLMAIDAMKYFGIIECIPNLKVLINHPHASDDVKTAAYNAYIYLEKIRTIDQHIDNTQNKEISYK